MRKHVSEQSGEVNGHLLFDFGRAAYAQVEVELDGRARDLVEVVLSECAENDHVLHVSGWRTFKIDNFRISPEQKRYRVSIPVHGGAYGGFPHVETPPEFGGEVAIFRYVEINHYFGPATVRRIEYFSDVPEDAARFESSDPVLDKVWDFCRYSILATSVFPCYVDGERERMPYEGDTYITELGHFCCGNDYSVAKRTMEHFLANNEWTWVTEWQLLTPLLASFYSLYSGDTETPKAWLSGLRKTLLERFANPDGLLEAQMPVRDIIDWPAVNRDGYEFGKSNFVPNAYRYGALLTMAELTGDDRYRFTAAALRRTLRASMMKNGLFVDSADSAHTALHTAMFALRFGLAEAGEIAAHQAILREKGMECSVYGAQFLLEDCFTGGMDALGIRLLTSDGPASWLNMLRAGSTVTTEAWDESVKPFQDWSHPWGAAPANIIPRFVGGVRPIAPGFARFTVQPSPAAPEKFYLRHPTPWGAIEVWQETGRVTVKLADTDRKLTETAPGTFEAK